MLSFLLYHVTRLEYNLRQAQQPSTQNGNPLRHLILKSVIPLPNLSRAFSELRYPHLSTHRLVGEIVTSSTSSRTSQEFLLVIPKDQSERCTLVALVQSRILRLASRRGFRHNIYSISTCEWKIILGNEVGAGLSSTITARC